MSDETQIGYSAMEQRLLDEIVRREADIRQRISFLEGQLGRSPTREERLGVGIRTSEWRCSELICRLIDHANFHRLSRQQIFDALYSLNIEVGEDTQALVKRCVPPRSVHEL